MLQQDLQTQQDQDHAAGNGGLFLVFGAEAVADEHTAHADDKGGHADDADGGDDTHPQEGEGNADRQGVDAGGDGHQTYKTLDSVILSEKKFLLLLLKNVCKII